MITDTGSVRIEVPRELEGTFEPQLIGKHELGDLEMQGAPAAPQVQATLAP